MAQGIFLHDYNTGGKLYDGAITANNKLANRQYVIDNAFIQSNNLSEISGDTNKSAARTNLGVAIGSDVQAYSAVLGRLANLAEDDGNFIVGSAGGFIVESGSTARDSLNLGTSDSPQFTALEVGNASDTTLARLSAGDLSVEGNRIFRVGGADVPVADGGTGASTAEAARSNLSAQESHARLDDISNLDVTDGAVVIGDGSNLVLEQGSTARASLGLAIGSDVQAYDAQLDSLSAFSADQVTNIGALGGLTNAANKVPMYSGSGSATLIDFLDEDDLSSNSATGVPSQQSVKAYVDGVRSGLDIKDSVRVASTAAISTGSYDSVNKTLTFSSEAAVSIDGVSLSVGDRILMKNQSTAADNGIYTLTTNGAAGTGSEDYSLSSVTFYENSGFTNEAESGSMSVSNAFYYTDSNFNTQIGSTTSEVPSSWAWYSDAAFSNQVTSGTAQYAEIFFSVSDYDSSWDDDTFNNIFQSTSSKNFTNFSTSFDDTLRRVRIALPSSGTHFTASTQTTGNFYTPYLQVKPSYQHVRLTVLSKYSLTQSELEAAEFYRTGDEANAVGISSASNHSGTTWNLTLDNAIIQSGSSAFLKFSADSTNYVRFTISDSSLTSTQIAAGRFKIDSSEYEIDAAYNSGTGRWDVELASNVSVPASGGSEEYNWYDPNGGGTSAVITRATDFDDNSEVTAGAFCFVEEGTVNADAGFVLTTNDDITVGSTGMSFTQFSGAGQITAGTGLSKSGNTINAAGNLAAVAGLNVTDGGIIVGDGSTFVLESGGTARTSLGLGSGDSPAFTAIDLGGYTDATLEYDSAGDLSIEGNVIYRAGGTDVPITDGGTGASDAGTARTNLGLAIGSNVQAYDSNLDTLSNLDAAALNNVTDLSALSHADGNFIVSDGSDFVVESGSTARDSLSLGTSDSPQFTGIELGHASDTTLARSGAGDVSIEGNVVYRAGGTTIPVSDGGTGATSVSAAQVALDLEPGVDIQAYDAGLQSIAGLTTQADRMIYTTGSDTYAVTTLSSFARTLLDDADAATMRATLGAASTDSTELSVDTSEPSSIAIGDVDGMYVYDISADDTELTVSLPSTATAGCLGKSVIFKIKSTVGSESSLTISGATNQTIDGNSSIVLNQERQAIKLVISEEHSSGATQCWVVV